MYQRGAWLQHTAPSASLQTVQTVKAVARALHSQHILQFASPRCNCCGEEDALQHASTRSQGKHSAVDIWH